MSEADKLGTQIARQLYAMVSKKKDTNLAESIRNERFQRTMSDEYPFAKKPRGKFRPVEERQRAAWDALAHKGE